MDFFIQHGANVSDHGIDYVPYAPSTDEEIEQILAADLTLEEKASNMVARANEAGGKDNISVILIDTSQVPKRADASL